jgi:hypothetical protein
MAKSISVHPQTLEPIEDFGGGGGGGGGGAEAATEERLRMLSLSGETEFQEGGTVSVLHQVPSEPPTAVLLPFSCRSPAVLLPFSCHSIAVLLPFCCHSFA